MSSMVRSGAPAFFFDDEAIFQTVPSGARKTAP